MKKLTPYTTTAITAVAIAAFAVTSAYGYDTKSYPKDNKVHVRAPVAGDFKPGMGGGQLQKPHGWNFDIFITDANNNNNDPNKGGGNEDGIAINPRHINEVVITSFAFPDDFMPKIPIWVSNNDGQSWDRDISINAPTGIDFTGFSADMNGDYTIDRGLAYTTLAEHPVQGLTSAVYASLTKNPATGPFNWFAPNGVAEPANHLGNANNVDQPWLLVGPIPDPAGSVVSENVYVAYDDFQHGIVRVAVAPASDPLQFNVDNPVGVFDGGVNPGHRLAIDKDSGTVYSAWENSPGPGSGQSQNVNYMLSRSTDGGTTWTLNGQNQGITVANADSTQVFPKFCTVNSLRGGADHIAVDPTNGDLVYVYGTRDPNTGSERLALRRLTDDGNGGLKVSDENIFVDGDNVQAAIPSIAINDDGVIGVFYYTCEGIDQQSGFPAFAAHFDISTDGGNTFGSRNVLEQFLSTETDDGGVFQRVLGDYMQVKAVGETFFASYVGNGINYGRNVSIMDPIYFNVAVDLNQERKKKIARR